MSDKVEKYQQKLQDMLAKRNKLDGRLRQIGMWICKLQSEARTIEGSRREVESRINELGDRLGLDIGT